VKTERRFHEENDGKPFEIVVTEVTHAALGRAYAVAIQLLDAGGNHQGSPLPHGAEHADSWECAIEIGRRIGRQWVR